MQQLLPCERENEEALFNQPVKAIRIKQAAFLRVPAFQAGRSPGSSPVSRSKLETVSVQVHLEPIGDNQAARGQARGRCFYVHEGVQRHTASPPAQHTAFLDTRRTASPSLAARLSPKSPQRRQCTVESQPSKRASKQVTEARSLAQRTKLDAQDKARHKDTEKTSKAQ
jgi:hypothetical protein